MNLSSLKNSNILLSIYVDDLSNQITLEETFYSVSKQTNKPDFLVMYNDNFNDNQIQDLRNCLDNPKITLRTNKNGKLTEEVIECDEKINYELIPVSLKNFSQFFNKTFNIALKNGYEFISIIEQGDVVGLNWYNQAMEYYLENKKASIIFPIIRSSTNGIFSGLLNEAVWAEGLSEEAGKIDLNLLQRFNCIIILGALIKISDIAEYSETKEDSLFPFKESIKISHYYEFLLRMTYNDIKSINVPRIGYELRNATNNIFKETSCKIPQNITQIPAEMGGVSTDEGSFWMNLAKQEYFFDEDRNKIYEKKE